MRELDREDPALALDQLPQPYRMIWRVIDEYILDPVWLEITRIHPELLQDETGAAFMTPHNQALQNLCTPSTVTEQAHGGTSLLEMEGLLFMTTDSDAFVVIDPIDGKIIRSVMLEEPPQPVDAVAEAAAAAAADPKAKKGGVAKPAEVTTAPPKPQKISSMWLACCSQSVSTERVLSFAVCSIVTSPEEKEVESTDPKKKGKGEVVLVQVPRLRVLLVHAILGAKETFRPSLITLSVVGEVTHALVSPSLAALGPVDMSLDGRMLCICTTFGCFLYRLPEPVLATRTAVGRVETHDELPEEEEVEEPQQQRRGPLPPLLLLLELTTADFFKGQVPLQAVLFPLMPRKNLPLSVASATTTAVPTYDTGLIVFFRDACEFQMLTLGGLTSMGLLPANTNVTAPRASATVLSRWRLSAAACAVGLDIDRAALAVGCRDGSICLYNLVARCFTSSLGQHESAVQTLSFLRALSGSGAPQHFVVSGAEDGSVCMFGVVVPHSGHRNGGEATLDAEQETTSSSISTLLRTFRLDVNAGVSVVCIRGVGDYGWAVVQCSDGMCLVYDILGCCLLGRLALYSGMTSRQVAWKICTFQAAALCPVLPPQPLQDDLGYDLEVKHASQGKAGVSTMHELVDPNAFTRLPPAKRAPKYAIARSTDSATIAMANSVATASKLGYHALYYRNGLPVLALFKVEDVFANFYPQIANALQSKAAAYLIDKAHFFQKLTAAERADPQAAVHRVLREFDVFGDREHVERAGTTTANRSQGRNRGTMTPGTAGTSGVGGATSGSNSRKNSLGSGGSSGVLSHGHGHGSGSSGYRRGSNNALTSKNVEALQATLTGPANAAISTDGSLLIASYERLVDPIQIAIKSAQLGTTDRTVRKNRLLNRLSSISTSF